MHTARMNGDTNPDLDIIAVLTGEPMETILSIGGTESWVLDRTRAARCDYVIVSRKAKARPAKDPRPHDMAFLIGKVKDVVPSNEAKGRWLILISEYAAVDIPDLWHGRNPVSYWKASDFPGIDFARLRYTPVTASSPGLTIAEAKAGLALGLNVPETAIEIIIRG